MVKCKEVPIYTDITPELFINSIWNRREPALLRGINIGECTAKWTTEYLSEKIGPLDVKVHVSQHEKLDFINKNFVYKTLPFNELLERVSGTSKAFFLSPNEYYYLRSLGLDPRGREIADIRKQFPFIAADLKIPHFFKDEAFFSSVLRIGSKNVQLWTHYDVMDNILIQVRGRKRIALFKPSEALGMYLVGDKSRVLDIDNPDASEFPKFSSVLRHECIMESGDIIFIPALWFHNTLALDNGIAVNVFWKHLPEELYDKKDVYGNKDPIPAARAIQMTENATKLLETLPGEYRDFYCRRMIAILENKLCGQEDII
ncbi:tRNA wybutosine-synthesizing protein 5-like [Schistocerca gregaria]|uniref:tRNA wybutosine-synthesizing protein 5-like n=1 Tax=Schistocerca gregaria TaxID=7010 RepID=UPI00211DE178|nr:tRNA wybutosine-synthesizing protein 5-like [Schistocerca gregaria]